MFKEIAVKIFTRRWFRKHKQQLLDQIAIQDVEEQMDYIRSVFLRDYNAMS